MDVRGALLLSIPTVVGSILGARIAVNIDEAVFRKVLAVAMLIMLVIGQAGALDYGESACPQRTP